MPNKIVLLNAVATGTVGAPYKVNTSGQPFHISCVGGYTGNVLIETSSDYNPSYPYPEGSLPSTAGTWTKGIGNVGGVAATAEQQTLDSLTNGAIVRMDLPAKWIRATFSAGGSGVATVILETTR